MHIERVTKSLSVQPAQKKRLSEKSLLTPKKNKSSEMKLENPKRKKRKKMKQIVLNDEDEERDDDELETVVGKSDQDDDLEEESDENEEEEEFQIISNFNQESDSLNVDDTIPTKEKSNFKSSMNQNLVESFPSEMINERMFKLYKNILEDEFVPLHHLHLFSEQLFDKFFEKFSGRFLLQISLIQIRRHFQEYHNIQTFQLKLKELQIHNLEISKTILRRISICHQFTWRIK
eukprot:gene9790-2115_t